MPFPLCSRTGPLPQGVLTELMPFAGTYDPIPKPPPSGEGKAIKDIKLDTSRAKYWLGVGAQPSEPAWRLLSMVSVSFEHIMGSSLAADDVDSWDCWSRSTMDRPDKWVRRRTSKDGRIRGGRKRGAYPELHCQAFGREYGVGAWTDQEKGKGIVLKQKCDPSRCASFLYTGPCIRGTLCT